jgi:hemerythrin-like metal-binding protein
MNRIARFCVAQPGMGWLILMLVAVVAGWMASAVAVGYRVDERRTLLETEAQRRSLEVMSQTLNANLMGSMAMFGLTDADIKSEALGRQTGMSQKLLGAFESVGRSYDAQGVFLVPKDGVITLSWDSAGKPSTGLNVRFRPYYLMAMKGKNNVYAAVSLARGDRALYFSAPVFLGTTNSSEAVGAVVTRTGLQKVDQLLRGKADIALLLSPQGVVFASNRTEWIGHISGRPTQERLQAIRELKQFGNLFEKTDPPVLPMSADPGLREVDGRSHFVASAKVQWNDPMGDWSLVLMEDLTRSVPLTERLRYGLVGGLLVLLIGLVLIRLLRSHSAQQLAAEQLAAYSSGQQAAAARKTELSEAGLQMQQARQVDELLRCYFNATHRMFDALQGVAYLVDRSVPDTMTLAGSYACPDQPPEHLATGEGLLGQCAVEKRSQVIDTASAGFATIRSGLGESAPAALLLAPLMLHDRFLGVVEVALLHKPDSPEQQQFDELTGLLAMNLEILGRVAQTEQMLLATAAAERDMARLAEAERFNRLAQGRETRIIELKREVNDLCLRLADPPRYASSENAGAHDYPAGDAFDATGNRLIRLIWHPVFESGNAVVDREHRALFAVSNDLLNAVIKESPPKEIDRIIGILVKEVTSHFSHEEAIQRSIGYAQADEHARIHRELVAKAVELIKDFKAGTVAVGSFFQFLAYDVVAMHMSKEDIKFYPLFEAADQVESSDEAEASIPKLVELVDLDELQKLFTAFCESVGIAAAIIDLEGTVLVSANWQRACTGFHRANPESCQLCIESDTELALQLQAGQEFTMYTCKNGLTDAAAPILVEGRHLANVFIGQFHLGPPDQEFFRQQARRFGYPEADYLKAVNEAPVVEEKRMPVILGFLSGFARMVGTMSLARHRADAAQTKLQEQTELLHRERLAAMSLAEDADAARNQKQQGAPS